MYVYVKYFFDLMRKPIL